MFVYKHAKYTEDDDGQILEIAIDKAYTNTSLDDNSLDELVNKVARAGSFDASKFMSYLGLTMWSNNAIDYIFQMKLESLRNDTVYHFYCF